MIDLVLRQLTFRDDSEHADRRECATVVAIELVGVVALDHDLSLAVARQVQVSHEDVSRVVAALA